MKNRKNVRFMCLATALASLMLTAGCGKPPVVNGGSKEAFERSYAELTAGMTKAEKEKFDAAIAKIMTYYTQEYRRKTRKPGEAAAMARMELSDLTPRQIIEKADKLH